MTRHKSIRHKTTCQDRIHIYVHKNLCTHTLHSNITLHMISMFVFDLYQQTCRHVEHQYTLYTNPKLPWNFNQQLKPPAPSRKKRRSPCLGKSGCFTSFLWHCTSIVSSLVGQSQQLQPPICTPHSLSVNSPKKKKQSTWIWSNPLKWANLKNSESQSCLDFLVNL